MPYVRCLSCDLPTYTPGTPYGRDFCPVCDAELPRRAGRPAEVTAEMPRPDPRPTAIDRVLELARMELDMDVSFLGEMTDEHEILRRVSGPAERFGFAEGATIPLDDTVCRDVLAGRLSNLLPDITADPACDHLENMRKAGVRAYIGVPLTTRDARQYMLCVLAGEERPTLDARDLQFLQGLAESARHTLDHVTD
jgi:GAF domain-containing protein